MPNDVIGSVMVVGGGIAGMQAALDLAVSGYYFSLVEKGSSIGGRMSQLDKTFPTNDCAMWIISPKLVEVGRHLNIELRTLSEVQEIKGKAGNFKVELIKHPRYIDESLCIACGLCAEKCPKKIEDKYNAGLVKRKSAFVEYAQAVPLKYCIDGDTCIYIQKGKCGACKKFCPTGAVDFDQKEETETLKVGSVVLAPGFSAFNPSKFDNYQYAKLPNVITAMEFERILSASGPTMGHITRFSTDKR